MYSFQFVYLFFPFFPSVIETVSRDDLGGVDCYHSLKYLQFQTGHNSYYSVFVIAV